MFSSAKKKVLTASAQNNLSELQKLLKKDPGLINTRDDSQSTPLILASEKGFYDTVKYLLHCGAQVDLQNKDGNSALHRAVYWNHPTVVKVLLGFKAPIDCKNKFGNTSVDIARQQNRKEISEILDSFMKGTVNFSEEVNYSQIISTTSTSSSSLISSPMQPAEKSPQTKPIEKTPSSSNFSRSISESRNVALVELCTLKVILLLQDYLNLTAPPDLESDALSKFLQIEENWRKIREEIRTNILSGSINDLQSKISKKASIQKEVMLLSQNLNSYYLNHWNLVIKFKSKLIEIGEALAPLLKQEFSKASVMGVSPKVSSWTIGTRRRNDLMMDNESVLPQVELYGSIPTKQSLTENLRQILYGQGLQHSSIEDLVGYSRSLLESIRKRLKDFENLEVNINLIQQTLKNSKIEIPNSKFKEFAKLEQDLKLVNRKSQVTELELQQASDPNQKKKLEIEFNSQQESIKQLIEQTSIKKPEILSLLDIFPEAMMEVESLKQIFGQPNMEMESLTGIVVQEEIGKGQFGQVFKGQWGINTVALKSLKGQDFSEFQQELKILKVLTHPNLLTCWGIFVRNNEYFMVLEYMNLGNLLTLLQEPSNKFSTSQLIDMLQQIASGMEYLHSKNIIHRDLAARNILCSGLIRCLNLKISDFGLSRIVENYYSSQSKKVPIRWTAPEALLYHKFTTFSDVWSFSITAYEIFSQGKVPYPTLSSEEIIERLPEGLRPVLPKEMPNELAVLIQECWDFEPTSRPSFSVITQRIVPLSQPKQQRPLLPQRQSDSSLIKGNLYAEVNSQVIATGSGKADVSFSVKSPVAQNTIYSGVNLKKGK